MSAGAPHQLTLAQASSSTDGYLSASDWNTFNNKAQGGGNNLINWLPDLSRWTLLNGAAATLQLNTDDTLSGDTSVDITTESGATGAIYTYGDFIPIDPRMLYQGRISVKRVAGAGTFSAGYAAYDSSKAVLAGNGSTYGTFIASAVTLTTGGWMDFSGAVMGEGTASNQFPVGTRFIKPLIISNADNVGTLRLGAFSIFPDNGGTPSGAVMAFDLPACPTGWTAYAPAEGRMLIGAGTGAGLTPRSLRDTGGQETHTLTVNELPPHAHALPGIVKDTGGSYGLPVASGPNHGITWPGYNGTPTPSSATTGAGAAYNQMPPYLALRYCKKL